MTTKEDDYYVVFRFTRYHKVNPLIRVKLRFVSEKAFRESDWSSDRWLKRCELEKIAEGISLAVAVDLLNTEEAKLARQLKKLRAKRDRINASIKESWDAFFKEADEIRPA